MAVAWIGNRETLVERAAEHAAALLESSRCPVFSFDTDIHGTRAAIALAERVGAAYDHVDGAALARETALFTDRGAHDGRAGRGAPAGRCRGDRRRTARKRIAAWWPNSPTRFPICPASNAREFFLIGDSRTPAPPFGGNARQRCFPAARPGSAQRWRRFGRNAPGGR